MSNTVQYVFIDWIYYNEVRYRLRLEGRIRISICQCIGQKFDFVNNSETWCPCARFFERKIWKMSWRHSTRRAGWIWNTHDRTKFSKIAPCSLFVDWGLLPSQQNKPQTRFFHDTRELNKIYSMQEWVSQSKTKTEKFPILLHKSNSKISIDWFLQETASKHIVVLD